MSKLNERQTRFVAAYIVSLNASEAARQAGYSQRTAGSLGQRLLKNAEIATAIAEAVAARSQRTQIDADWLLRRLAAEAEADIAEIFEPSGELKPISDWPKVFRTGLVGGIEIAQEGGREGPLVTVRKIKLADRTKHLDLIGRHVDVAAWRERVEVTGKNGGPIEHKHDLSDDDLAAIAAGRSR